MPTVTAMRHQGDPTGREKAAILLASLDNEVATRVYKTLNPDEVELLVLESSNLRKVSADERNRVIKEFHGLVAQDNGFLVGGVEYAQNMLRRAFGDEGAEQIMERIGGSLHVRPFEFARRLDTGQLLSFLQSEYPQTIALVLAYLDPLQAATVMSELEPSLRTDVALRIATMDATGPDVIEQIEQVLESRFAAAQTYDIQVGGVDALVQIINGVHPSAEKAILSSLAEKDPELAEEVKKRMFVFEDIVLLDDRSLQRAIREFDSKDLQLALKRATDEVKNAIFRNISERMAETIREEMEYMGPVRVADVDDAQQRIVAAIRQLEESGEVVIARGGGADVIV